jgi:hypothetical protein
MPPMPPSPRASVQSCPWPCPLFSKHAFWCAPCAWVDERCGALSRVFFERNSEFRVGLLSGIYYNALYFWSVSVSWRGRNSSARAINLAARRVVRKRSVFLFSFFIITAIPFMLITSTIRYGCIIRLFVTRLKLHVTWKRVNDMSFVVSIVALCTYLWKRDSTALAFV